MSHFRVWRDWITCATWLIHVCDMTHSYVWHDSFTFVMWLVHVREMTCSHMYDMTHLYVGHDSFTRVTWLIHMWLVHVRDLTCPHMYDMTHLYVQNHSLIFMMWSIHICDVTHSYLLRDSFIFVTWLVHVLDLTCSHTVHATFIPRTKLQIKQIVVMVTSSVAVSAPSTIHAWTSKKNHKNGIGTKILLQKPGPYLGSPFPPFFFGLCHAARNDGNLSMGGKSCILEISTDDFQQKPCSHAFTPFCW